MITETLHDFGWCLNMLRQGCRCRRRGWRSFIALTKPDEEIWALRQFIYIEMPGVRAVNPYVLGHHDLWMADQVDILAEDWEVAE